MLSPVFFDRFTMGFSLSIHIILAVIGMILPVMILLADYLWIRKGDNDYKVLSNRLTKVFVVLFAVGTASGILVSVNLFFLWPSFMALVSKVAILPVYMEVFAFFIETIFLTIYVFFKDAFRSKFTRIWIMLLVAISAGASGALITVLNSFMNTPVGFNISAYLSNGSITSVNPIATFFAPAVSSEVTHVLATSYFAGAAIFMSYFAYMLIVSKEDNKKRYYEKALKLVFVIVLIGVFLSIITGINSIEALYHIQPEKYAAIELNLNTTSHASELIGGEYVNNTIRYGFAIPNLQSVLATGTPSGIVPGLNQFPKDTWPPLIIHILFDIMFGLGVALGLFFLLLALLYLIRKHIFRNKIILSLLVISGIVGLILLEIGWIVDEIGRQPWIIYNVMTVSSAANQSTAIIPIAILIVAIYAIILQLTYFIIRKIFANKRLENELVAHE